MKNANQFKKFQFFEVIEGDARSNRQTAEIKSNVTYVLNDVTPIDMKTIDNFLFLSAKVPQPKTENPNPKKPQIRKKKDMMLKIYKSKILEQYELFNSSIIAFDVKSIEEKKFLFAFGTDINEGTSTPSEQDDQKTPTKSEKVSISSLKIFDITSVLDTNNESQQSGSVPGKGAGRQAAARVLRDVHRSSSNGGCGGIGLRFRLDRRRTRRDGPQHRYASPDGREGDRRRDTLPRAVVRSHRDQKNHRLCACRDHHPDGDGRAGRRAGSLRLPLPVSWGRQGVRLPSRLGLRRGGYGGVSRGVRPRSARHSAA